MPNLANITVKKADGTTDIVYSAISASAGDKSPAMWRANVGSAPAFNPELRVSSEFNGPRTARRVKASYAYPYTVTGSDGKVTVSDRMVGDFTFVIPQSVPSNITDEAAVQLANLIASTLVKEMLKTGYAAT